MFENATTMRTLGNIETSLKKSMKNKYNVESNEIAEEFLKLHGLSRMNFDFINVVSKATNEKLNDVSIDDNSNRSEKTVEGIMQETFASGKKALGMDYLYRQMKELYGKEEAQRLTGEMYDLSLGLSDSTNILKPYCWALDASKIIIEGRPFGQLKSGAPNKVASYISALCETIHQMSSHLAGAIAIGTFFIDVAHLCLYKHKIDLRELKTNIHFRKYIEDEFQQFVHSVNHLSRNGAESPFTNVSVLDRVKLKTLIRGNLDRELKEGEDLDMGMSWYFPFKDLPINDPTGIYDEKEKLDFFVNYILDYIIEIQNIYLDFFDKGDPLANSEPYRFPVTTLNIGKKLWGGKYIIEDNRFLQDVCKRDIFRYNIFASEGTKIASCCRLINNSEMMKDFASQSNSFGAGGSISIGSHRVVTINFMRIALEAQTEEQFFDILSDRINSAAMILKAHKELIKRLTERGLQSFISMGWININRLFSTFGIMGIYECSILFKEKFGNGRDVEGDILRFMNKAVENISEQYEIAGNIEQIPGESFAVRLATADRLLFGEEAVPYPLYANQFIPLWKEATLWEKIEEDGKYNSLITGGGIVHATIADRPTSKQAEKIIRKMIASGCEHVALNAIFSRCEDGHSSFGYSEVCPVCGKKIVNWVTRIVGYFTEVSSWNKPRREWEFPRRTRISFKE